MSTRISAGVDALVSLLFINMIRIDCKITKFSSHLFAYFLGNNYNIGKLTSAATKEWPQTFFSWVPHQLINESY